MIEKKIPQVIVPVQFPMNKAFHMGLQKKTLRQHFEKMFTNQELVQWFDPLSVTVDDDNTIVRVSFPHFFFAQWFLEGKRKVFEQQLSSLFKDMRIVYENGNGGCDNETHSAALPGGLPVANAWPDVPGRLKQTEHQSAGNSCLAGVPVNDNGRFPAKTSRFLSESHRFDTFIANRKNDFPLAAARQAIDTYRSPVYTPFVVYGQSGAGKTHLLGAMAHALRNVTPEIVFFYGSADDLDSIFPSASSHSWPVHDQVILIDDIQRVYRNPDQQDTLVSLIDLCHISQRLLVFSADVHPADIPGMCHRLLSRLTGGLVVELKKPDMDVRRQYLQQKNNSLHLGLTKERILALAQQHQDIRSIDGLLARISAYRSLVNIKERNIENLFEYSPGAPPDRLLLTPNLIIELVAGQFSVSAEAISGKDRDKSLSLARPVAMLLCRELLGLSLVQVGKIFNGRDHSTVLYSLNKIKTLLKSDKNTNNTIATLKQMCLSKR